MTLENIEIEAAQDLICHCETSNIYLKPKDPSMTLIYNN